MALPSGADVKIGSYEFMIDWENQEPYNHFYESLYSNDQGIDGTPGKRTANPNYIFWRFDDWSGGEGVKYFDVEDPTTYWYGKVNPRVIGALNGTPTRTATTGLTTTTATPEKLILVSAAGTLWLLGNRQLFYSTNGTSWTAHGSNPVGAASDMITAACSTGDEIWYATQNSTTREVWKATTSTVTQAVNDVTGKKFIGMAEREGFIYGFTGKNLLRYNSKKSLPFDQTGKMKVHKPHTDSPSGTYYGGMAAAENSVLYFIAYAGDTTVYEFRKGRGYPVWNLNGMTGKAIAYNHGIAAMLCQVGTKVQLWGMNLRTRQPFHLADVGKGVGATTATCLSHSYDGTFIMGVTDGTTNWFFSYNVEMDSISELDELTVASQGTADAIATYNNARVAAYFSSTTVKADSWTADEVTGTNGWEWVSGAYDMRFPQDQKILLGFHVTLDPTVTNGTVTVYYQDDEDGTWTSAGSTSNGDKHKFIDLTGSTVTFRTLRVKVVGVNGARMYSLTAKCYMNSYQQAWRLALKLKDEQQGVAKPSSRTAKPETLRSYLHTLATGQAIVAFLDGARIKKRGGANDGYTSHTVVLEFPEDRITGPDAEGTAIVMLRDVTTY